jgi:hypothetical protein
VVASLVEEAYRKGKQEGREEIQKGIKDLLDICDEADDYIYAFLNCFIVWLMILFF